MCDTLLVSICTGLLTGSFYFTEILCLLNTNFQVLATVGTELRSDWHGDVVKNGAEHSSILGVSFL